MKASRFWLSAALAAFAAPALAQMDPSPPKPIDRTPGSERLDVGEDGPPESPPDLRLPPPSTGEQIEAWRRDLVGKPVFGPHGGLIGTLTELSVGLDNRVIAAVVTVRSGARLPLRWAWVRTQVGRPTVVAPWSAADIEWLQGAGGR